MNSGYDRISIRDLLSYIGSEAALNLRKEFDVTFKNMHEVWGDFVSASEIEKLEAFVAWQFKYLNVYNRAVKFIEESWVGDDRPEPY